MLAHSFAQSPVEQANQLLPLAHLFGADEEREHGGQIVKDWAAVLGATQIGAQVDEQGAPVAGRTRGVSKDGAEHTGEDGERHAAEAA